MSPSFWGGLILLSLVVSCYTVIKLSALAPETLQLGKPIDGIISRLRSAAVPPNY